jgi:hypothetical protein
MDDFGVEYILDSESDFKQRRLFAIYNIWKGL